LLIFLVLAVQPRIAIGLFTRFTVIPLIIAMGYAFFVAGSGDLFDKGELAALFLSGYFALLLCGPGRISVDGVINK
jgi:putative oxidoreductase